MLPFKHQMFQNSPGWIAEIFLIGQNAHGEQAYIK